MVSLNGTVPLSQMHYISMLVCQNLKFNMTRMLNKMFDIHGIITKGIFCLTLSRQKCGLKFLL